MRATVSGSASARRAAQDLRLMAARGLAQAMDAAVAEAFEPMLRDISNQAEAVMPETYARVLTPSLRTLTEVHTVRADRTRRVVRIYARGRSDLRDVRRLDSQGRLRHPLWGSRNYWYTTQVRPGFVTRPVDAVERRVYDASDKHLGAEVTRFNKG